MPGKKFKPTWGFSIVALLVFWLLVSLGFWQLHRYHDKQVILKAYHVGLHTAPLTLVELEKQENKAFQRLDIQGRYLNDKTILLDNRWHEHQLGYEILTPVKIAGENKALLVNRGWVPAPAERTTLPSVLPAQPVGDILGYVHVVNPNTFILGKNISDPTQRPLRIQKIDIQELQKIMGVKLYPFVLRLDSKQSNGFVRQWAVVNVMPERHLGYAVQWFVMSFVLVLAFLGFSWRKGD